MSTMVVTVEETVQSVTVTEQRQTVTVEEPSFAVTVIEDASAIAVDVDQTTTTVTVDSTEIDVTIDGAQGTTVVEVGIIGPQGPPGTDGDKTYIHTQAVPSATWTVTHNLDKMVSVSVVDSSNRTVIGDIEYIDLNSLVISFSAAFAGAAYCN